LIDNKVGNILRSDNIDIESMSTIDRKLIETNNNLTEYATIRNKVIEELLKLIKN
jgi:hypothetical protein